MNLLFEKGLCIELGELNLPIITLDKQLVHKVVILIAIHCNLNV